MAQYGELRADFITYTTGTVPAEANQTITVSSLVNNIDNPTYSGSVIISGDLGVSGISTFNDITVTGNAFFQQGISASGVQFTQSGTGAVDRTVESKLQDVVSVKDFGAVGTGQKDDAAAIENAINANPEKTVFFPAGRYLVSRPLNLTNTSYSIKGEKCTRGQNTNNLNHASIIDFSSGLSDQHLVNKLVTGGGSTGPFIHENIYFRTGAANGFQFGDESLPVTDGGTAQKYNFGVRFIGCNFFSSTSINFEDAADGTVTRLTNTAIGLTKAFESVIEDCSFYEYKVGIRLYGCDKPVINRVRGIAEIPIDIQATGTFTVQHVVDNFQSEGWKFTPVRINGAGCAVTNYRSEGNKGSSSRGMGRFVLPGVTATITAGSLDVTFSSSMDNILIPGLSLIELTDGADNTDTVLVTAVSGTTVTVTGGSFVFTDSYNASTVTRIHGYGLIHNGGPKGTTVVNASPGVYENCPAFVMVSGRSNLAIANALAESGQYGNIEVLALGNRSGAESFYMQNQMILTGCSGLLVPSNPSPLISVSNFSDSLGNVSKNSTRMPVGDSFDGLKVLDRKWIYTPKRYSTSNNNNQDVTFKELVGDPDSAQSVWAWYLGSYASTPRQLRLYDSTIPSTTNGALRIRVKAKKKSSGGTTTITLNAEGAGGATITSFTNVTDEWSTFTWIGAIPSQWSSSSRGTPTLRLTSSDDVYISAVVIEDVAPPDAATGRSGFYKVSDSYSTTSGVSGTGNLVATLDVEFGFARVKIYGYVTGITGYSHAVKEFNVGVSKYSGALRAEVFENISNKYSVNASVASIDFALAKAIGSNGVELTVTPTITGSNGATSCRYFADIEFTSFKSNPQINISA